MRGKRCPLFEPGLRNVVLDEGVKAGTGTKLGIVASGMSCSLAQDVLADLRVGESVSLYKVVTVFPVNPDLTGFVKRMEKVLVVEETDTTLESIIDGGGKVLGRSSGFVPRAGELTYDVVRGIIERALDEAGISTPGKGKFVPDPSVADVLATIPFPARPPKLCAGCSHKGILLRHEAGLS